METPKNPYTERTGYIWATNGENGWFCVFDRSKRDKNWKTGTHQWLIMKMPDGPERTTRTRDEAVRLASASAGTTNSSGYWWK
jgi:hypothetical protein